jgi:bifunctional non-homologous end joining protein LigD
MMVEDHPIDYMKFEGTIPAGNYGAGTVMVWDFGNYLALGAQSVQTVKNLLLQRIKKGEIKVVLNGEKLQGGFALIKTRKFLRQRQQLAFDQRKRSICEKN